MNCPFCDHPMTDLGDGEYWCQQCNVLDTREAFEAVKRGRKPSQQPALAYDYRRAITLVQALATNEPAVILRLAKEWGVSPIQSTDRYLYPTLVALAQHALEHARKDRVE